MFIFSFHLKEFWPIIDPRALNFLGGCKKYCNEMEQNA
jgi:hypothetical protein